MRTSTHTTHTQTNSLVIPLPVLDWADIRKQEEGAGVDGVDGSVHDGGDQGLEKD